MNPPEQYIIIWGNPNDGFGYVGTFDNVDDASEYASNMFTNDCWWISKMDKPAQEETTFED